MKVKKLKTEIAKFDYVHTSYLYYIPEIFHNCTLNNFDFSGQKKLSATIRNFVEGLSNKKGLFFWGSFGVGKTHLLVALYRVIVSKYEDCSPDEVYYTSFEKVVREIKSRSGEEDFLDILCNTGWLFLDDISAVSIKDTNAEILRTIINSRYEGGLTTCFSSNLEPSKLEGLHPHAISRINGMCDVVKVVGKDRRV
jgi:primosomal protein DnaI